MRITGKTGPYYELIDAPSPDDPSVTVRLGILASNFQRYMRFGLATYVAQYYGIVLNGLGDARHLFRGLKRPLMLDADMDADENILIYSWRPKWDYEWSGTPWGGFPVPKAPPTKRVFVVLVRREQPNDLGVFGAIEKWNWVMEDSNLEAAPVEWYVRYAEKLWSREA